MRRDILATLLVLLAIGVGFSSYYVYTINFVGGGHVFSTEGEWITVANMPVRVVCYDPTFGYSYYLPSSGPDLTTETGHYLIEDSFNIFSYTSNYNIKCEYLLNGKLVGSFYISSPTINYYSSKDLYVGTSLDVKGSFTPSSGTYGSNSITNGQFKIEFTPNIINGWSIDECRYSIDSPLDYSSMSYSLTKSSDYYYFSYTPAQDSVESHTFYIACKGNDDDSDAYFMEKSSYAEQISYTFDTKPPVIESVSPESGSYNYLVGPITVDVDEDSVGCQYSYSSFDYGDAGARACSSTSSTTFTCSPSLTEGDNNIYLSCEDEYGNSISSDDNYHLHYFVDITPPIINVINLPVGSTCERSEPCAFTWSISDNLIDSTHAGSYFIYRNGTLISSSTEWSKPQNIDQDVDSSVAGYYNYSLFSYDHVGNMEFREVDITIEDTIPPDFEITSPPEYTNTRFYISISSTDDDIDMCWVNDTDPYGFLDPVGDGVFSRLSNLDNGTYSLLYTCNDTSNNINKKYYTINVDTEPPIIHTDGDISVTQYTSLILNYSMDDLVDHGTYNLYINNTPVQDGTWYRGENVSYEVDTTVGAYYNFTIVARDYFGNPNSSTHWITIIDNIPPKVDILSPPDINQESTIFYEVYTNESIDQCFVSINGTGNLSMGSPLDNERRYFLYDKPIPPEDGVYLAKFSCNDTFGNFGYNSSYFIYGGYPPVVVDKSGDLLSTGIGNDLSIFWKIVDNGSAAAGHSLSYTILRNGTVYNNYEDVVFASGDTIEINVDTSTMGYYNYTINFTDGDHSNTSSIFVNVLDDQPPDITINSPDKESYGYDQIYLEVSLNEEGSLCNYSLNGNDNVTMSTNDNLIFYDTVVGQEGSNFLEFFCEDLYNNLGYSNVTFTIDTQPPYIVSRPLDVEAEANSSYDLLWTIADDLSPPGVYNVTINDTFYDIGDWINNSAFAVPVDTNRGVAYYNYTIWFNDSVGNVAMDSVGVTIVDTTGPNVSSIYVEEVDPDTNWIFASPINIVCVPDQDDVWDIDHYNFSYSVDGSSTWTPITACSDVLPDPTQDSKGICQFDIPDDAQPINFSCVAVDQFNNYGNDVNVSYGGADLSIPYVAIYPNYTITSSTHTITVFTNDFYKVYSVVYNYTFEGNNYTIGPGDPSSDFSIIWNIPPNNDDDNDIENKYINITALATDYGGRTNISTIYNVGVNTRADPPQPVLKIDNANDDGNPVKELNASETTDPDYPIDPTPLNYTFEISNNELGEFYPLPGCENITTSFCSWDTQSEFSKSICPVGTTCYTKVVVSDGIYWEKSSTLSQFISDLAPEISNIGKSTTTGGDYLPKGESVTFSATVTDNYNRDITEVNFTTVDEINGEINRTGIAASYDVWYYIIPNNYDDYENNITLTRVSALNSDGYRSYRNTLQWVVFDSKIPEVTDPYTKVSAARQYDDICISTNVTETYVQKVLAELTYSNGTAFNLTLQSPDPCGFGNYGTLFHVADTWNITYNRSYAFDKAGNLGVSPDYNHFIEITEYPYPTFLNCELTSNIITDNENATLSCDIRDNNGIDQAWFFANNTNVSLIQVSDVRWEYNFTCDQNVGAYSSYIENIYANDTDVPSNENFTTFNQYVTCDPIDPVISDPTYPDSATQYSDVCINITATDIGMGIQNVDVDIRDPDGIYETWAMSKDSECVYGADGYGYKLHLLKPGNYTIVSFYAFDGAGNSNILEVDDKIESKDIFAPTVIIDEPKNATYNTGLINVTFHSPDENYIYNSWFTVDGGDIKYDNGSSIELPVGTHNVTAYINDSYGKIGVNTTYFTINTSEVEMDLKIDGMDSGPFIADALYQLNVNISNTGDLDAMGATMVCYDNGAEFDRKTIDVLYNTTIQTYCEGSFAKGDHNITVVVEPLRGEINTIDNIMTTLTTADYLVNMIYMSSSTPDAVAPNSDFVSRLYIYNNQLDPSVNINSLWGSGPNLTITGTNPIVSTVEYDNLVILTQNLSSTANKGIDETNMTVSADGFTGERVLREDVSVEDPHSPIFSIDVVVVPDSFNPLLWNNTVYADIYNYGNATAVNANATIHLPPGVHLVPSETETKDLGDIDNGTFKSVSWQIYADYAGSFDISVTAQYEGGSDTDTVSSSSLPQLSVGEVDYLNYTKLNKEDLIRVPVVNYGSDADNVTVKLLVGENTTIIGDSELTLNVPFNETRYAEFKIVPLRVGDHQSFKIVVEHDGSSFYKEYIYLYDVWKDDVPPDKVPSIEGYSTTNGYVVLNWEPVDGAYQYYIYKGVNGETTFDPSKPYVIVPGTQTSFVDYNVDLNRYYYYRVAAVDDVWNVGEMSRLVTVIPKSIADADQTVTELKKIIEEYQDNETKYEEELKTKAEIDAEVSLIMKKINYFNEIAPLLTPQEYAYVNSVWTSLINANQSDDLDTKRAFYEQAKYILSLVDDFTAGESNVEYTVYVSNLTIKTDERKVVVEFPDKKDILYNITREIYNPTKYTIRDIYLYFKVPKDAIVNSELPVSNGVIAYYIDSLAPKEQAVISYSYYTTNEFNNRDVEGSSVTIIPKEPPKITGLNVLKEAEPTTVDYIKVGAVWILVALMGVAYLQKPAIIGYVQYLKGNGNKNKDFKVKEDDIELMDIKMKEPKR